VIVSHNSRAGSLSCVALDAQSECSHAYFCARKQFSLTVCQSNLYSLDGKLWFSKPHDFAEYKQRRAAVKTTVQQAFALRVLSEPIARGAADFWG